MMISFFCVKKIRKLAVRLQWNTLIFFLSPSKKDFPRTSGYPDALLQSVRVGCTGAYLLSFFPDANF